ncbi:hypothetical protein PAXRUDRAFT_15439 [Paxillus rubicundulus Ve08.2h10]|uniref:Unplaced genomic scaffold scaffold_1050, whole genome shotgun sequence n=1 Tax=Paxillus rubicundulus Ve08.2h10 TaxID=930991 RepID=A0A0D0DHU2_9AGAM|nr:hypothetical protein PAXRUDRAFT_15439 [Paxillus rubicundulus Ve08.2h10]
MSQLTLDGNDNTGFWLHAKQVFNRRFHAMNTDHHTLTLFLHPMCRKLAISQAANGRNFEFMVKTALSIAKQWRWGEVEAKSLVYNLKEYQKCTGVFAGGQANALDWWECLPITATQCPLKAMAIILHSVVPHAADVERYFSGLGSTHYTHHLYKMDRAAGKSTHRKHAHMHTRPNIGIDTDLADELARTFTWVPPLVSKSDESEDSDVLAGPEAITDEELAEAFDVIDHEKVDSGMLSAGEVRSMLDPDIELDGSEVLEGRVYDRNELEVVNRGTILTGFVEDISVLDKAVGGQWDVKTLLSSEGVTSSL